MYSGKRPLHSGKIFQRSGNGPLRLGNFWRVFVGKRLLKGSGLRKVRGDAVWPFTAATQQKHENAMCTHGPMSDSWLGIY